jgi:galactokinase
VKSFRAPGRVNLIGGHVDYHEGFVVPMAIDRDIVVDVSPRDDGRVVVSSHEYEGLVNIAAGGTDDPAAVVPAWGRAVGGVVRTLADAGRPPAGADIVVRSSTLPVGAGLSSSAAFEVVVALALCDVASFSLPVHDLVLATQRAEHLATGVPCGMQDQTASLCGRAHHALMIDCRSFTIDEVPMPPDVRVLIVHSGVPRTLESSPYAQRRAEGMAVAADLGLRVLRDATPEQVRDRPRGRHVVSEMARVLEFADALRAGDVVRCGELMRASHASLRDDMEVSLPQLDALVDRLVHAGAYGARLTGGGFGGCVVALVPERDADRSARAVGDHDFWIVAAADGAGPVD